MQTAIEVIKSGMAFGWIPEHLIHAALQREELVQLSLKFGGEKTGGLFISLADENCSMSQALAENLLRKAAEIKT